MSFSKFWISTLITSPLLVVVSFCSTTTTTDDGAAGGVVVVVKAVYCGSNLGTLTFSQSLLLSNFCPSLNTGLGLGTLIVVVCSSVTTPKMLTRSGSRVVRAESAAALASLLCIACDIAPGCDKAKGKAFCKTFGTCVCDNGSTSKGPVKRPKLKQK